MTESAPEQAAESAATETATVEVEDTTDWKAESRKWEARSKENAAAAKEHQKARESAMTESERAVAEAEERGKSSVRTEYGQRLARSEFLAEAAKRNPTWDAQAVLEDLNLARYVGDDGEPDSKAILAAVGRIVPGSTTETVPPAFDLGARKTAPPTASMNGAIRLAAGRA